MLHDSDKEWSEVRDDKLAWKIRSFGVYDGSNVGNSDVSLGIFCFSLEMLPNQENGRWKTGMAPNEWTQQQTVMQRENIFPWTHFMSTWGEFKETAMW